MNKIRREVNARVNRDDLNKKSADTLLAIENIFEEENKKSNIDLVVIDCLIALNNDEGRNVSGSFVKRIFDWLNNYDRVTFILIHHEGDRGDVKGQKAIKNRFDAVYRLETEKQEEEATILRLTSKLHYGDTKAIRIRRTFKDGIPTHKPIEEEVTPIVSAAPQRNNVSVSDAILELVANDKIISLIELCEGINKICNKKMNKTNIYKQLKILEEEKHLIMRANGKNWEGGIKKHKEV